MKPRYKIWLETTDKAFGEGPFDLLTHVDRLGSLSKAAKEMNMSYSHAWELINTLEKRLGFPLLSREVGGSAGGGSYLTEEARQLMDKYSRFMEEAGQSVDRIFKKYF